VHLTQVDVRLTQVDVRLTQVDRYLMRRVPGVLRSQRSQIA
jgi:hypothetical protein